MKGFNIKMRGANKYLAIFLSIVLIVLLTTSFILISNIFNNKKVAYAAESDYRTQETVVNLRTQTDSVNFSQKTFTEDAAYGGATWSLTHTPTSSNHDVFQMSAGETFVATRLTNVRYITQIASFYFTRGETSWGGNLSVKVKIGGTEIYSNSSTDSGTDYDLSVYKSAVSGELSGTLTVEVSSTSSSTWYFGLRLVQLKGYVYKSVSSTLNDNGGINGQGTVGLTYGEIMPNVTIPTKQGHVFEGYYIGTKKYYKADGTPAISSFDIKSDSITLYASWIKMMQVVVSGNTHVYNRNAQSLLIEAKDPNDETIDGFVIKYSNDGGLTYTLTEPPAFTTAGTHTVYYQITKDGYATVTDSADVTIQKSTVNASIFSKVPQAIEGLTYNSELQDLIVPGALNTDDDYGEIQYRVVANDTEEVPYASTIPQRKNVKTYTIYYKTTGSENYLPTEEKSFTVTISEVDKSALAALIESINDYYDKISEKYADDASTLEGKKQQVANEAYLEPNVTAEQVAAKIEELKEALSTAKVSVVTKKIEEIGAVELTDASRDKINDALDYYNKLTAEEKELVSTAAVEKLQNDESSYAELVHDYNVKQSVGITFLVIGIIILLLGCIYLLMFFVFNRYTVRENKVIRVHYIGKKEKLMRLLTYDFKIIYRPYSDVFKYKGFAESLLDKTEKSTNAIVEDNYVEAQDVKDEKPAKELSLKETMALAGATKFSHKFGKKEIANYLKTKNKVEVNERENYTKTGLPLADTHYVNGKCFAYVYETEGAIILLAKMFDDYANTLKEKHPNINFSAFPKSKDTWYSLILDDSYTKDDVKRILDELVGEIKPDEGMSLKESMALAKANKSSHKFTKKFVSDYLKDKENVEVNTRENFTKTGLPLADTHYANGKCFAYVYETKGSIILLAKMNSDYANELKEKHDNINFSAFPKQKEPWYSLIIDDTYTKEELEKILDDISK